MVGVFSNAVFQLKTKRYVKRWAIFQTLFTSDPCERRRVFEAILVRFGLVRISVRCGSWFGAFNCDVTEKLSHVTVSFSERIALPNHSLPPSFHLPHHLDCLYFFFTTLLCLSSAVSADFVLNVPSMERKDGGKAVGKSGWEKVVKSWWEKVVKSGWLAVGNWAANMGQPRRFGDCNV